MAKIQAAPLSSLALLSAAYVTRVTLGLPLRVAALLFLIETLVYAVGMKTLRAHWAVGLFLAALSALITAQASSYDGAIRLVYWEPLGICLSAIATLSGWFLCGIQNGRAFGYGVGVYFLTILALSSWVVGNANFFLAPLQIGLAACIWMGFMALVVLRFRRLSPRAVQSLLAENLES